MPCAQSRVGEGETSRDGQSSRNQSMPGLVASGKAWNFIGARKNVAWGGGLRRGGTDLHFTAIPVVSV